ncbi:alpha/beta-hydrolase [Scenedesmus sp. NREL 46B-D3]|nr:alpha/beta-hydrolase [Scenedesmus sp. NREL 46B-D3]
MGCLLSLGGSCCPWAAIVALIACGLAALAYLPPLEPAVQVGAPVRTQLQTEATQPLDFQTYTRTSIEFPCVDATCEAWLYMPKGLPEGELPPVVVMAHGMGGQKDFGLHKYAENFAQNGMAAFAFDYRGWGGSGGEPRHWLSAKRHMADWRAAIAYVRGSMAASLDTSRLCLWGSSFAGGHVLVVGSEPQIAPHITAIVAQVPNLDAAASTKASIKQRGVPKSLRMLAAGLVDLLRTAVGREPLYLPLAGLHGSLAFMQMTPGELERYHANHPKQPQGGWVNLARAAYSAEHALFKTSPIKHVHAIIAPVLYMGANKDTLCPMDAIKRAVALTPTAELYAVDCDHFELFTPQHMPGLQRRQLEFLLQHVGAQKAVRGMQQEQDEAVALAAAAAEDQVAEEAQGVATS